HILSEVEQICDRVAILNRSELICSGSINELLGTPDVYQVKGTGGDWEVLKKWIPDIEFIADGCWQGSLSGEPYDFMASLRLMGGQIITINLFRPSLEEFFMEQVQK
ncbi:MAG: multidrug ABC transporter ATP-binding protein, partial [Calothrix sp. SM1_7_51]|nr:multidrug ABC transporter ATP-binding protein [Calothrix sp. SM1_7_51]